MAAQKYGLDFQPKERRKRDQMLRFLGGFGAILLLLGIVSAVALQRGDLIDQIIDALHPTESTTEAPKNEWAYTGKAQFLLCETDDKEQSLRFCALVEVDAAQKQIHIFPLAPDAKTPYEGSERTLEQALKAGGPKELKAAVEALSERTVDRFISSTDTNFVKAINVMGSVTVQVKKKINYRGDPTLILAEGSQRLQGDRLLRYFRYLGTLKDGTQQQGELLKGALETYFEKEMTEDKLEDYFNSLMNLVHTDLSIKDFFPRRNMLLSMLTEENRFTVDVKV